MRSHSRLDLYAKSFAVTGLGCLGALGALIDYWPNQTLLPDVPSVVVQERVPSVLTVVDLRGYASEDSDFISLERLWFVMSEASERPRRVVSDGPRIVRANLVTARPMAKVTFVGPVSPVPESLSALVEYGIPVLPVETLAELGSAPESWEPTSPTPTTVLASNRSDDGFFSGVLRKTTSSVGSVGSTISKAGGSVVGAFRSVGGLVKRAF